MLVAWVLLLVAALSEQAVQRSKAAEERGFSAVDDQRWCDAHAAFLEANHFAPSVDLIFNAAQAADLAKDRKRALKLYAELLGAYPGADKQEHVNRRLVELSTEVKKHGAGKACPEPELPPLQDDAPDAQAGDAAPDATSSGGPPTEVAPPPLHAEGAGPPTSTAETPDDAPEAPTSAGLGLDVWAGSAGLAVAGAGAASVLGAAVLMAVSLVPYFGHASTRQQILEAEASGVDVGDLQAQQAAQRAAWESWGELGWWSSVGILVVGLGVFALGAVGAAAGFLLLGEESE